MKMGCWRSLALASFLLAVLSGIEITQVRASIHEYSNEKFTKIGNAYFLYGGSEGLKASVPKKNTGVANGKSFISFDDSLKFTRTAESASKVTVESAKITIEAIIFELADKENFGSAYMDGGERNLCCTKDLANSIGCSPGEVIITKDPEHPDWPQSRRAYFRGDDRTAQFPAETINITLKGMYTLYFVFCEPELQGLTLEGKTIWKNPGGYLPGKMAPLFTFYGIMSLAYLTLGLLWFIQYVRYWKEILQLQNCITAVIALGMCEMATWYFDFVNFNATGKRPIGITVWAVTFSAVKKTVSRLLVLVVSMGYGVVLPTLGGLTSKVILLGATYFAAAELLDVVEHVGTINDASGNARLFLVLPVAILDAFFILWIFTSLSRTLEKLQVRKRYAKLELYRKFTNALAIAVIVAVLWIGYELYFKATDKFSERWESAWIISAFWIIFTFVLLIVICLLWAPSQNSTSYVALLFSCLTIMHVPRFAYSEDVGEDYDEEAVALTTSGAIAENEKNGIKVDPRKPVDTNVFSLQDDDPEEDKRE